MPPVLGPASPSSRRLWSWDTGSSSTSRPSVTARTEISSPSRNASITTVAPGVAEGALAEHRAHGRGGLAAGGADDRALAGGEARGLHHQRLGVAVHVVERRAELLERAARGGGDAGGAP